MGEGLIFGTLNPSVRQVKINWRNLTDTVVNNKKFDDSNITKYLEIRNT